MTATETHFPASDTCGLLLHELCSADRMDVHERILSLVSFCKEKWIGKYETHLQEYHPGSFCDIARCIDPTKRAMFRDRASVRATFELVVSKKMEIFSAMQLHFQVY